MLNHALRTVVLFSAAFCLAVAFSRAHAAEDAVSASSPDGGVRLDLFTEHGKLEFSVVHDGADVILRSPLVMTVDEAPITSRVRLLGHETYEVDETYPWRGPHSTSRDHCRGARVQLADEETGLNYEIELRAYNDGVAFRLLIPAGADAGAARVPDEATEFVLPADCEVWFHDLEGHYEATYDRERAADIEADQWLAPPVMFKLPETAGYAAITEANLANYSGMALRAAGDSRLRMALGHAHPASYPFRLRYEADVERLKAPAAVTGPIHTPWRVVLVGDDLNAVVNADVIHNLCPPPSPDYFPEGMDTAWIKPGRAVWKYLDGGGQSLEDMKDFSRWAGELGFEYHVVEGFWSRWSDEDLREFVDYSREQGVGLWFWRHSKELRTPEAREEFFSRLQQLGVVGAKIDFLDHEHKEVIDHYSELLEDAARHQIMVNFHGANKPTGEARTWPNELTREAVRGMEARRLQDRARHNTILPFTRYLAGHGDYTPVIFGERRGDTSWAHQIATAAVFDEPLLTYGAHPKALLENPAVEMIKAIPSVWDETIVLPASAIGELAVFARRSGRDWFLAVLNGPRERTESVPLSFLGEERYQALLVADGAEGPTSLKVTNETHAKSDVLKLQMPAGGGFIARFAPRP